jgi:prevent-host-death family protein
VPKVAGKKKSATRTHSPTGTRAIAAGEFKAKCLALIDEVNRTGQELVITKRGKPMAKLTSFPRTREKTPFIGRLEGILEIVGDPDDLIKPVFPEEDWDMLK